MGRLFTTPLRLRFIVLAACSLFLTSCLDGGKDCEKPFETVVSPDSIKNSNQIFIAISKLDFLDGGNFVIDDVTLEAGITGKHKKEEDITLDMNGTKLSRRDGAPYCDAMSADGSHSRSQHKLHKMYLNGGMTFELFLLKLKLQKGTLRIGVNGKNIALRDAVVRFKGRKFQKCPTNPNPNPNPDPKPVATTTINSVSPATSPTASTNITFAFSANQTGVTFYCSLDGAADALCTSPKSYSGLSAGNHTFKVYSKNSSGVAETPAKSYTWTIDNVAPTVTITNAAQLPHLTNQSSMSFAFSSNKPGTFECKLDGGAFAACTSPKAYSGVSEGSHSFAVRAIDSLGNVSGNPASFDWSVDLTAPVTSILTVNPAAAISNVNARSFEFAASESSSFECSVDNGSYQSCQSPVALSNLSEGGHYFQVRAKDLAGNTGVEVAVAWKNDYTAPVLTFGAIAPAAGVTRSKNLSAEFAADENVTYFCAADGGAVAECTSPWSAADVADGAHEVQVYAVDAAGNQSQTGSVAWTVDSTAPTLSFSSILPSSSTYLNSNSVSFGIAVSEQANLAMDLNGLALTAANPIEFNGLPDGAYTFTVSAMDDAGNAAASIAHNFVIDTVAPSLTVVPENETDNPTRSDMRRFEFSGNEDVSYECDVDNAGFAACATPFVLSGLADGLHNIDVKAIDLAGNSSVVNRQWTVDTRAPLTTISANLSANTATFSFTADEQATFECAMDLDAPADCASPKFYSGLSVGSHVFTVWATDVAGNRDNAGVSYSFSVSEPVRTTINSRSVGDLTNQTSATFTFSSNRAVDGYLCSMDGGSAVFCGSPYTVNNLADGPHTFTVRALAAEGLEVPGASSTWTVDTIAPVPNNISPTATTNSVTVTWTTAEMATSQLRYGVGVNLTSTTAETSSYQNSHSIRITGLSPNTMYTIQVLGRDQAGNPYVSSTRTVRTSR